MASGDVCNIEFEETQPGVSSRRRMQNRMAQRKFRERRAIKHQMQATQSRECAFAVPSMTDDSHRAHFPVMAEGEMMVGGADGQGAMAGIFDDYTAAASWSMYPHPNPNPHPHPHPQPPFAKALAEPLPEAPIADFPTPHQHHHARHPSVFSMDLSYDYMSPDVPVAYPPPSLPATREASPLMGAPQMPLTRLGPRSSSDPPACATDAANARSAQSATVTAVPPASSTSSSSCVSLDRLAYGGSNSHGNNNNTAASNPSYPTSEASYGSPTASTSISLSPSASTCSYGGSGSGSGVDGEEAPLRPLLHSAALSRNRQVVASLLRHGAATVDERDARGRTALHVAAGLGDEALTALLLRSGADPRCRDARGRDALYVAVAAGRQEIVELLLTETEVGR